MAGVSAHTLAVKLDERVRAGDHESAALLSLTLAGHVDVRRDGQQSEFLAEAQVHATLNLGKQIEYLIEVIRAKG